MPNTEHEKAPLQRDTRLTSCDADFACDIVTDQYFHTCNPKEEMIS